MKELEISPSACDVALKTAVEAWRVQHRLREDDAVLLLVELLKIHQDHWEELRRRDLPSFEPLRKDITTLLEANRALQRQSQTLSAKLSKSGQAKNFTKVTRTAAWLAALAGALGGFLLGRAFQ